MGHHMTTEDRLPRQLAAAMQAQTTANRTAAMLAVALEEIEDAAHRHGLDEVSHLAGVARLAAWERADIESDA